MTVVSIAVIWLAVGLVVAMIFGSVIGRTNQAENDAALKRRGAEVKYLRRAAKRLRREAAADPLKRHTTKPHAVA